MSATKSKATKADVHAALETLDSKVVDLGEHERRKHQAACKPRRQDLSDDALMLECLFDLYAFDADERGYMHAIVARSLGKAPEQKILVNEVELGRQLSGDSDVLEGSFRKRARRMYAQMDAKQRAAGRLAVRRENGMMILGAGKEVDTNRRFASRGNKKLVSAEYFAPIIQGVVDGVDMARPGNERRIVRFRRAARIVFDSLPECKPLLVPEKATPFVRSADDVVADVLPEEAFEQATGEASRVTSISRVQHQDTKHPRPLRRFKDNAALALRAARERDARKGDDSTDEFNRQAAALYVELGRTVAEVQTGGTVETEAAIRETIALLQAMLDSPQTLSTIVAPDFLATICRTHQEVDSQPDSA
jgi:hypothetical protein